MEQPSTPTIEELLGQGIKAARVGRRDTARELLMRVIEVEERNEQAWLWLAAVVDTTEDQRICLENVLEINPGNAHARKGLDHLTAQASAAEAQPAASAPTAATGATVALNPPAPTAATGATVALNPPAAPAAPATPAAPPVLPCPYCGAETTPRQRSCRRCHRSLRLPGPVAARRSVGLTILAAFWALGTALTLVGMILLIMALIPLFQFVMEFTGSFPFELLAPPVIMLIFLVFNGFVTVGLFQRKRWAFVAHLIQLGFQVLAVAILLIFGAAIAALLVAATAEAGDILPMGDLLGGIAAGGGMIFVSLLPLFLWIALTVMSWRDFYGPMLRISTEIEGRDSEGHYNMGVLYKNRGMWYMAAQEWQGAVKGAPRDANYRHALGLAYAQINQYDQALAELRAALNLTPNDPQIQESIVAVERRASRKGR